MAQDLEAQVKTLTTVVERLILARIDDLNAAAKARNSRLNAGMPGKPLEQIELDSMLRAIGRPRPE